MHYHFTPILIPILASSLLSFSMAVYAFTHSRTRGAVELAVCSLIVTLWAVGNAGERAGTDLKTLLFWANVQYIAYGFSPISWFTLVFRFNGKEKYVTARNLVLISIVPAITAILVWFDPVLGLVRHSFVLRFDGDIAYIQKVYGPWFWFHYVYVYIVHFVGLAFLVAAVGKRGSIFRRQSIYLLVAISIVNLTNLAYVLGFAPIKHFDLTPIVFSLSTVILYWGIFRHKIFRVPPIARAKVFELMANGILVVDENWNLIDSNEAAQRMFDLQKDRAIGRSLRDRLTPLSLVTHEKLPQGEAENTESFRWEIMIRRNAEERYYELDASRLQDPAYKNAWVIMAEDVTDLKRAREQIMRQREELAVAADRDRLSMELHDTLGQVMSFAVIQSDTVLRELGKGNYALATSYIARVRDILKDTHEDLRGFVRGIRMSEYGVMTLANILEKEAERARQSCGLDVALTVTAGDDEFTQFQKSHLAGIVKEALNNIAKHAKATRVWIDFAAADGGYQLSLEDNGIGLDEGSRRFLQGSGMGIMRERAASIGGSFEVNSWTGRGTRVVLMFPGAMEKTDEDTDR